MKKNSLYLLSFTDAIEMELDEWYDKKSSELLFHLLSRKKLKRKNGDILKYEWIIPKNDIEFKDEVALEHQSEYEKVWKLAE